MKIFDAAYLKPKKLIPIVIAAFITLNAVGYVLAIKSEANAIATKAIKDRVQPTEPSRVTLLPWGFKIRFFDGDGDARFIYLVSNKSGSIKMSAMLVRESGKWKLTELTQL